MDFRNNLACLFSTRQNFYFEQKFHLGNTVAKMVHLPRDLSKAFFNYPIIPLFEVNEIRTDLWRNFNCDSTFAYCSKAVYKCKEINVGIF
jgi:hypothetical protein